MSAVQLIKYGYLAYLAKPVSDRFVYRKLWKLRPKSLVEIGLGSGVRTQRMLNLLLGFHAAESLRYTGIDLFEARQTTEASLTLKQAHTMLKPLGVKLQLVPGDPYAALARTANSLPRTDCILVSRDVDAESLARAWLYVPRMLHETSLVLLEESSETGPSRFREISAAEITKLVTAGQRGQRRAA